MGVYRLRDGVATWWLSWTSQGKRYRESSGTTDKAQAEALLAKKKKDAWEGEHFPNKPQDKTLEELEVFWVEYAAKKKTLKKDKQHFRKLKALFGAKKLCSTLRVDDLMSFRRRYKYLSPASQNRVLEVLRAALKAAGIPHVKIKMMREDNKRDRIATRKELKALMDAANPAYRALLLMGYYTGARQMDLRRLKWKDIDLQTGWVTIVDHKTDDKRTIPLHPALKKHLRRYMHEWPTEKRRKCNDGNVFPWKDSTNLSKYHNTLRKKAKVEGLNFHDLRHTLCTRMRQSGVDLNTTMKFVGHKSMKTAMRYQTVETPELKMAIAKVA